MSENHVEARKDLERSIKARNRAIDKTDDQIYETSARLDELKTTKRTLITKREELNATLNSLGGPLPKPEKEAKEPTPSMGTSS